MNCPNCSQPLNGCELHCPNCGEKVVNDFVYAMNKKPTDKQRKVFLKVCLVLVFVCFIGIVATLLFADNTPYIPTSEEIFTPSTTQEEKPIEIGASVLIEAYKNNELQADSLYDGKQLIVSGKVASIGKNILSNPYITITPDGEFSAYSVYCYLTDEAVEKAAKLKPYDNIVVKGKCTGESAVSVSLKDVIILS